jgi:Flp pilus assembly protein CpaB
MRSLISISLLLVVAAPLLASNQVAAALPNPPSGRADENLVPVLVATKDISTDTFLTKPADVLEVKRIPFETVPKGSYRGFGDVQDQRLVNRVKKGEFLTQHHILDVGPDTFREKLPPGCIPFTVRIDPEGMGGTLPADRRDVVLVAKNGTHGVKVWTMLTKIPVLATDTDAVDKRLICLAVLAVNPEQAKLLKSASAQGSMRLFRPPYGDDQIDSRPVTLKELLRQQKKK